jgi:hypothetical protein
MAKHKVRATTTFVKEYELDPDDYGVPNLEAAIELDKQGITEDPFAFIDALDVEITVDIVELK